MSGEAFDVVSGVDTSLSRAVEILLNILLEPTTALPRGQRKSFVHVTLRFGYDRSKPERLFGRRPRVPVEGGIQRLLHPLETKDGKSGVEGRQ